TGKNANVFYEVGYAHALGKPTILITKNADDIPFDLKHFPHIIYKESISDLRVKLMNRVKWFVEHPANEYKKSEVELDLYFGEINLSEMVPVYDCNISTGFDFKESLTIHNTSTKTLTNDDYSFNIISRFLIQKPSPIFNVRYTITRLPTGEFQSTFGNQGRLLPSAYQSVEVNLTHADSVTRKPTKGDQEKVIFRIITKNGSREFSILLKVGNQILLY
ncbi:MAG: hypothetical protein ABIK07_26470, partial [Planctomycetota bacterium]